MTYTEKFDGILLAFEQAGLKPSEIVITVDSAQRYDLSKWIYENKSDNITEWQLGSHVQCTYKGISFRIDY